jgi:hemerythrin-like domain-containing protein
VTRSAVSRRQLLVAGGVGLLAGGAATEVANLMTGSGSAAAAIPPGESLMNEHGVLKRVLLVYNAALAHDDPDVAAPAIHAGAEVVHDFIETFHEAVEEGFVFPALRSAGQLVSTVDTLQLQHGRGRLITEFLLSWATPDVMAQASGRQGLADAIDAFDRMYQPHEAREDTVVFPAYRALLTSSDSDHVGQVITGLQAKEFGGEGFAGVVERVAAIERSLGILDLEQFTPAPFPSHAKA